jgi:hypothetical protein
MLEGDLSGNTLESFEIQCSRCGSSLGSGIRPSEIPQCCYYTLVDEIVRMRRSILQHRKDNLCDDGCIVNDIDNELYETIGAGKSAFCDPDDDGCWLYDIEGNRVERREFYES